MVRIVLPAGWTQGHKTEFTGTEGLLPDVIRTFVTDNPEFRHRLIGPNDQLLTYINLCIDEDLIPRHLRNDSVVGQDCTVTVIAPMAGG